MKKIQTTRVGSSLLRRLVSSAAVESSLALASLVLGGVGLYGYFDFQASALAAEVTPLAFAFGPWPFVVAFAAAVGLGAWAFEKSR